MKKHLLESMEEAKQYKVTAIATKADLAYWKKSGNKQIQNGITDLLTSIAETPFEGIGKP